MKHFIILLTFLFCTSTIILGQNNIIEDTEEYLSEIIEYPFQQPKLYNVGVGYSNFDIYEKNTNGVVLDLIAHNFSFSISSNFGLTEYESESGSLVTHLTGYKIGYLISLTPKFYCGPYLGVTKKRETLFIDDYPKLQGKPKYEMSSGLTILYNLIGRWTLTTNIGSTFSISTGIKF